LSFLIAETFTNSLAKLTGAEQASVKQAAFEFQMNPSSPGFNFEPLQRPKDPRFRSFRVNRDIRIIVHQIPPSLMLCYVGHHEDAYGWAERRRIEVHPTTGAAQMVEVVEREVVKTVIREEQKAPPLFAGQEADYLMALGVPAEWLDAVRQVDQAGLEKLIGRLPEEAMERLMELAVGNPVPRPAALIVPSPFDHPDAQRRFRVIDHHDELRQALDYPWEKWVVFLHPSQRQTVERKLKGPGAVSGSAGTGKSVVALHRAAWLAKQDPSAPTLLTTFSRTLAVRLGQGFNILVGGNSPVSVTVEHLHKVAADLWVLSNARKLNVVAGKALAGLVEEANAAAGGGSFTTAFLRSEWASIIDPFGIRTWDDYRAAPRARRGKPLGARQKLAAWRVFEKLLQFMKTRDLRTWDMVCHEVAPQLAGKNKPFRHVIVDESQDFGPAELKLVRALCPAGENDLFLCGDAGQRIYRGRCSWGALGIDIRGRSVRLKLNYRTTENIRRFADRLLPGAVAGGAEEGEGEKRDAVSLLQGPEPTLAGFRSPAEEVQGLTEWIREMVKEGFRPNEIAIFGRTETIINQIAVTGVGQAGLAVHKLADDEPPSGEDVFTGTMHRAKGLEFKAVAVVGVHEAALPLRIAVESLEDPGDRADQVEQERQLFYVACSRARERLYVSYTGQHSPFLKLSIRLSQAGEGSTAEA
jgi:hypothetical protein